MSRYIDADKAKEKKVYSKDRHEYVVPVAELDWLPTADVQEVRHGHWIKFKIPDGVYEHMKCSNCSFYWSMSQHSNIFLRCPHCGAFMDEEEKQQ